MSFVFRGIEISVDGKAFSDKENNLSIGANGNYVTVKGISADVIIVFVDGNIISVNVNAFYNDGNAFNITVITFNISVIGFNSRVIGFNTDGNAIFLFENVISKAVF